MRADGGREVYEFEEGCVCGKQPMGVCDVPDHRQRYGTELSVGFRRFWWLRRSQVLKAEGNHTAADLAKTMSDLCC